MESSWTTQVPWEAASNTGTWSTTTAKTSRTTTSGTLDADCPPKSSSRSPSVLSKRETGGTSPEYVAKEITTKKFANIILVTDGEVGDHSVSHHDKILDQAKVEGNFKVKKALCYVIGGYSESNQSVNCLFTRFWESKVFSKNGAEPLKSVMQYTA